MKPARIVIQLLVVIGLLTALAVFHQSAVPHTVAMPAAHAQAAPALPEQLFSNGDIVLRHGIGLVSEVFASFSQTEKKYSHAGIVSIEHGHAYVYHTMGGSDNALGTCRRDRLAYFCRPVACSAMAVYRYDAEPTALASMVQQAQAHYRAQLQFDEAFDLDTDAQMYCSEFIYKVTTRATNDENYLPLTHYKNTPFVAIDNLYLNTHATHIYSQPQ